MDEDGEGKEYRGFRWEERRVDEEEEEETQPFSDQDEEGFKEMLVAKASMQKQMEKENIHEYFTK